MDFATGVCVFQLYCVPYARQCTVVDDIWIMDISNKVAAKVRPCSPNARQRVSASFQAFQALLSFQCLSLKLTKAC